MLNCCWCLDFKTASGFSSAHTCVLRKLCTPFLVAIASLVNSIPEKRVGYEYSSTVTTYKHISLDRKLAEGSHAEGGIDKGIDLVRFLTLSHN